MNLQTQRLVLSELASPDLRDMHLLHSSPEVDRYNTLGIPKTMQETEELLLKWFNMRDMNPRGSYVFCIRTMQSDQFIGLIALNMGKLHYKIAEVWYKLLPTYWGNGYATEALQQILKFGFKDLQLHRIEAGCAVENTASIRVLEKAGMVKEGRKRKILPIRGEWVDNYFYSILETEFYSMSISDTK